MLIEYKEFLSLQKKSVPIYYNPWWLDLVCGENNWICLFAYSGDVIVAAWPVPYDQKRRLIITPTLTQRLGPLIFYPENQKYEARLGYEKKIVSQLIDQLPKFNKMRLNLGYDCTNWLPYYWKGFEQTTRYSYVIDNMISLESVYKELKSSARGKIKKGGKYVDLVLNDSIEEFYRINSMTFIRQGMRTPYSLDLIKAMDNELRSRGLRKIFFAKDKETGRYHSALYLMWDSHTSYLHLMGDDPSLRNHGAGMFLIWKAIEYTFEELRLRNFDFEGSMIEGIEEVRRSFGAVQKQYFQISKTNSRLEKVKEFIKTMR